MGFISTVAQSLKSAINGQSEADMQKKADAALSNMIMRPAIDRAIKRVKEGQAKFGAAIKGEG